MAMSLSYDELFKATLSMFNIDLNSLKNLSGMNIQAAFREVIKAEQLCRNDFERLSAKKEAASKFQQASHFASGSVR
jgi:hypothetical protein